MVRRGKTPKLGQHLLTSRDIARAVVEAGDVQKGDMVLEVGPGTGMLTRELLEAEAHVVAIEKDPAMIAALRETFPGEIDSERLRLIECDAREVLKKLPYGNFFSVDGSNEEHAFSYKVVANIPYYITGELLRLFLNAEHQPKVIALLVQKEVAERIVAKEKRKKGKESILSLSVKAYGEPRYVRTVKAGSFNPPPSVDSAILSISNISRNHFTHGRTTIYGSAARERERQFFELVHVGFGQKRKTLLGNLKRKYPTSDVGYFEDMWKELGFNTKVRAEDVPLQAWLGLTSKLTALFSR